MIVKMWVAPYPSGRRIMRKERFKWNRIKYFMWQNENQDKCDDVEVNCILCRERLKAKSSTAVRHLEPKHPSSKSLSTEKKQQIIKHFECMYARQINTII